MTTWKRAYIPVPENKPNQTNYAKDIKSPLPSHCYDNHLCADISNYCAN